MEKKEQLNIKMGLMIRNKRKLQNVSQIDLANKLEITQGCLSKIERGVLAPNVIVWLEFCHIFNLSPRIILQEQKFNQELEITKSLINQNKPFDFPVF